MTIKECLKSIIKPEINLLAIVFGVFLLSSGFIMILNRSIMHLIRMIIGTIVKDILTKVLIVKPSR